VPAGPAASVTALVVSEAVEPTTAAACEYCGAKNQTWLLNVQ
jgi:hypothetical protein